MLRVVGFFPLPKFRPRKLRSLTDRQSLSCRRNLDGIQPRVLRNRRMEPEDQGRRAKGHEQNDERTFRSPGIANIGWRPITFSPRVRPAKKVREEKSPKLKCSDQSVCRRFRYLCFSKRRAISGFGFIVFGIIQLHSACLPNGVIACIQRHAGKIRGVHSRWVGYAPGPLEGFGGWGPRVGVHHGLLLWIQWFGRGGVEYQRGWTPNHWWTGRMVRVLNFRSAYDCLKPDVRVGMGPAE